jgi:hypothetical protein
MKRNTVERVATKERKKSMTMAEIRSTTKRSTRAIRTNNTLLIHIIIMKTKDINRTCILEAGANTTSSMKTITRNLSTLTTITREKSSSILSTTSIITKITEETTKEKVVAITTKEAERKGASMRRTTSKRRKLIITTVSINKDKVAMKGKQSFRIRRVDQTMIRIL